MIKIRRCAFLLPYAISNQWTISSAIDGIQIDSIISKHSNTDAKAYHPKMMLTLLATLTLATYTLQGR